jgi:hypothetical protein
MLLSERRMLMCPADAIKDHESDGYYDLDREYNTVTVEDCPYCGETHVFSIEPEWETIQKSRLPHNNLPEGVRKFIVECPKQRSLFEIFVKVK